MEAPCGMLFSKKSPRRGGQGASGDKIRTTAVRYRSEPLRQREVGRVDLHKPGGHKGIRVLSQLH